MKKLFFGATLIALAYGSYLGLDFEQSRSMKTEIVMSKVAYDNRVAYNDMSLLINKAESLEHIVIIEYLMTDLSSDNKERLAPYLSLKKASLLFNQGEDYLKRAIGIESSVVEKEWPSAIPEENVEPRKYHPLTIEMINKATDFYEQARIEADKLVENGDVDFNYSLNYLKGEIYYRYLELLADNDTAQELFNQTLNYYKLALRCKPCDIDTVVNVELLIKNQNALLANANNPNVKRKQMLNLRQAGSGSSKGN